jgi:phosphoglycerol transferase MdoB-like AlkP superfamily enzyme
VRSLVRETLRTRPDRSAFARLAVSASSYLLLAAVLLTAGAKLWAAFRLELPFALFTGAWAILFDLAIYLGLASALAFIESKRRSARYFTWPFALVVFALAAANAAFLVIAGEQGNLDALVDLWERRRETWLILSEDLANGQAQATLLAVVLVLVLVPFAVRFLAKRSLAPLPAAESHRARARAGIWVALPAVVLGVVLPHPSHVEAYQLGESAMLNLASGPVEPLPIGHFRGYARPNAVSETEIAALSRRSSPDVLVVVVESLRFDHTSLAGDQAKVKTPNLLALAQRGFSATETRAVLPHTTKSVFSALCGRVPTMQRELIEHDERLAVQCLPHVLAAAGYRTSFFQSALGTFESRPRLVDRLGYAEFKAFEDLRGKRLGYVGSDDASLVKPVLQFLAESEGKPSFATVLTSAMHHPYRLSKDMISRAKKRGVPHTEPADAYARLVEEADKMLGSIIKGLRDSGKLDSTLVVVLGDHGEGFGQHGARQHDNNFFEEGLRVPLVMAGPGVAAGGRFAGNASVMDVAPSVLGQLGVAFDREALDGFDLLRAPPAPNQPRPFGCYRPSKCRGFVAGEHKVILNPNSGDRFMFDLSRDPKEETPLVVKGRYQAEIEQLNELIDSRRNTEYKIQFGEVSRYQPWRCAEGSKLCRHPRAASARYR